AGHKVRRLKIGPNTAFTRRDLVPSSRYVLSGAPRRSPHHPRVPMSALFSSIKLAGLELPNRLVVSPMCQYSADDGSATDWHMMHLGMLPNSGAALVVVEATAVERRGRITHGCLGLYSDDNELALGR